MAEMAQGGDPVSVVVRRAARVGRRVPATLALLPVIAVAIIIGTVVSGAFLTTQNFINILQQSAELSVLVLAETLVLLTGKFDISLESTVGLAPMVAAWISIPVVYGGQGVRVSPFIAIVACIAVGAVIGLWNGFLIVKLKLEAFIVTLAMLILLRGLTVGVSGGATLYNLPAAMTYLGTATWLTVPVEVWLAGFLFLVGGLFMRFHSFGRSVYAIGGSYEAARAAGIRVDRVLMTLFVAASTLAALAGLMLAGRLASVTSEQGQNLIFFVFAAAVIGGVRLTGGRGTLFGALTGVLLLGIVQDILTLSQIPTFWINAAFGAIILAALCLAKLGSVKEG